MRSFCNDLLFMHGHIVDVELARRLADATEPPPDPPAAPSPQPRRPLLRRLAALLGWLGCGAVRAWPN